MKIDESAIENHTLALLAHTRYEYIYAPEIAFDVNIPEKSSTFSGNNW